MENNNSEKAENFGLSWEVKFTAWGMLVIVLLYAAARLITG